MGTARFDPRSHRLMLAALVAISAGGAARADPEVQSSVRLEVEASPDCTSREELQARVTARSRRLRFGGDPGSTRVHARVTRTGAQAVAGELAITGADGMTATRRLSAPSCDQASDALALVIVLALDPAALASPAAANAPPPSAAPVAPAAPLVVTAAPARPSPAERPSQPRLGAAVGAQVVLGPAPQAMAGAAVSVMAGRDRASMWSPALVVSLMHVSASGLAEPGGTAAFALDAANLDACFVRLATSILEARACGSALVGRLAATGTETYAPGAARRPFLATGATAMASTAMTRHLELGLRVQAAASWIRDWYLFSPTVFHRAAPVTGAATLWLGVRFR